MARERPSFLGIWEGERRIEDMKPLRFFLDQFLFKVGAILLSLILVAVALDVVFRYALRNPIMWMGELATIGLVWMVFLCAALAISQNANLRIELIVKIIPKKLYRLFNFGLSVLLIFLFCLLIIIGIRYTIIISKAITGALRVSQAYFYAAVPVSAFFMLLYEITFLFEDLKLTQKKDD